MATMDLEGLKRKLTESYDRINKMKNVTSKIEVCRRKLKVKENKTMQDVTSMMDTVAEKLYLLQESMEAKISKTAAECREQLDDKEREIHLGFANLVRVCVEADKVLRGRNTDLLGRSCQRLFARFEEAHISLDVAEKLDTERYASFQFQDNSEQFLSNDYVAKLQHFNKHGKVSAIDEFWAYYPNADDFAERNIETNQEFPEDLSSVETGNKNIDVVRIREKDLSGNRCVLENFHGARSYSPAFVPPPPGFSRLRQPSNAENSTCLQNPYVRLREMGNSDVHHEIDSVGQFTKSSLEMNSFEGSLSHACRVPIQDLRCPVSMSDSVDLASPHDTGDWSRNKGSRLMMRATDKPKDDDFIWDSDDSVDVNGTESGACRRNLTHNQDVTCKSMCNIGTSTEEVLQLFDPLGVKTEPQTPPSSMDGNNKHHKSSVNLDVVKAEEKENNYFSNAANSNDLSSCSLKHCPLHVAQKSKQTFSEDESNKKLIEQTEESVTVETQNPFASEHIRRESLTTCEDFSDFSCQVQLDTNNSCQSEDLICTATDEPNYSQEDETPCLVTKPHDAECRLACQSAGKLDVIIEEVDNGQENHETSLDASPAAKTSPSPSLRETDTTKKSEKSEPAQSTEKKTVVSSVVVKPEQTVAAVKSPEVPRPIKTRKPFNLSHLLQHVGEGLFEIRAKCVEKIRGDFNHPTGVCVNSKGDVIVADTANHIMKICNNGRVVKKFGADLKMWRPSAVVVNEKDEVFVKDDQRLYHFDADGQFVKTMGKNVMNAPYGLGLTREGKLVVVDALYSRGRLHQFDQDGNVNTFPYQPLCTLNEDSKCRFLAVHGSHVLTSDLGLSCLYLTNLKGELSKTISHRGKRPGEMHQPAGIAVDKGGNWVVADSKNNRVQVFAPNGYYMATLNFSGESVRRPSGVFLTDDGLLYVINYLDSIIKVFKMSGPLQSST